MPIGSRSSLITSAAATLLVSGTASAAIPVPTIAGPLRTTARSYPFGAADDERRPEYLRRDGYVENEYVMRGRANVYDWPNDEGALTQ